MSRVFKFGLEDFYNRLISLKTNGTPKTLSLKAQELNDRQQKSSRLDILEKKGKLQVKNIFKLKSNLIKY